MATSRNLTYLGSPFRQGEGKATVVDTLPVAGAFLKGMEGIKTQRDQENKAIRDEKQAQAKSVEDYKVDYFINHQSYFQGRVDDIRKKGVELLMKGYDLRDYRNKEVADWQKSKIEIDSQAKLSRDIGQYMDGILKLDADKRSKIKTDSYKQAVSFLNLPLEEQIKQFQNGTMASLQVLNKIPMDDLDKFATQINKGIPSLSMLSQEELNQNQIADQKRMRDLVYQMVTPDMIDSTDPKVIEERINAIADDYTNLINKSYEDLKSKMEFEQDQKFHDDDIALRKRDLGLKERQFNWTKQQTENAQIAIENYDEFINGVVEGNLDNVRTLEDLLTVSYKDGVDTKTVKPTVSIERKQATDKYQGGLFNPLMVNTEEYAVIDYGDIPDKGGNLTKTRRIKIRNADGTINEDGVNELKGVGRVSFKKQATSTGVKEPAKTGTKVSSTKQTSSSANASSNSKPANQTSNQPAKQEVKASQSTLNYFK